MVETFLKESGMSYIHLHASTPEHWKIQSSEPFWIKPKGINQRNKGLSWVRENCDKFGNRGVVYIADDDNSYSIRLFDEVISRFPWFMNVWSCRCGTPGGCRHGRSDWLGNYHGRVALETAQEEFPNSGLHLNRSGLFQSIWPVLP